MTGIYVKKEYKKWMFLFAYGIYLISAVLYDTDYKVMDLTKNLFPIVRFLAYVPRLFWIFWKRNIL